MEHGPSQQAYNLHPPTKKKSPRALQDGEQYFPPDSLQLRNECSAEKQNHHRGSGELLLLTRESAIFKTPVISASKTESYQERSRHISVCFPLSSAHTSPAWTSNSPDVYLYIETWEAFFSTLIAVGFSFPQTLKYAISIFSVERARLQ